MTDFPEKIYLFDTDCDWMMHCSTKKGHYPDNSEYIRADLVPTWQPIETAPIKAPILITNGEVVTVTILDKCGNTEKWMYGHGFSGFEWDYDFCYSDATHWMPLPEPPANLL